MSLPINVSTEHAEVPELGYQSNMPSGHRNPVGWIIVYLANGIIYGVAKEPISTNSITEMHPVYQEDSSGQTRQDVKEKTAHISVLEAE